MDVYVGQTRSRALIAKLTELGYGECTNRGEYPPRRRPWFLDNGAFSDWKLGLDFDAEAFWWNLILGLAAEVPPDFVVCPDRVAGGLASLEFSLGWIVSSASRLSALSQHVTLARPRWYLAVQDGMKADDVRDAFQSSGYAFDGIFIGGTLKWKLATGEGWVQLAHELGVKCHAGRIGTARRVRWAMRIGADSLDSTVPLWSKENLRNFVDALSAGAKQTELPW